MGDLSPHFDRSEFACHHCGVAKVSCELVAGLEELRRLVGRPIRIVSGYRCPRHNKAVGGAQRSRHVYGDAADLEAGYCTAATARAAGFRGIGTRGRWAVHVDMRPDPASWVY